jgi:hypothetical protein
MITYSVIWEGIGARNDLHEAAELTVSLVRVTEYEHASCPTDEETTGVDFQNVYHMLQLMPGTLINKSVKLPSLGQVIVQAAKP